MVVAEGLADPEVGEDDGGDPAVQRLQGGRGADGDQQVGGVQDLAHVPVHQTEVGGRAAGEPLHQLLVRQFLDVRGVLARLGAQLQQHLAVRVQLRVPDEPVQQVRTVPAVVRDGRLYGEDHRVGVLGAGVRRAAQEGQGDLGDRGGVGPHALVHGPETVRVLAGVGEDEVRAVPQQQTVGELLVDDTDVSGDDHGPLRTPVPGPAQAVQHRLDAPADEGEHDDVVRVLLHGVHGLHGAQEFEAGHLAQGVGADADLLELAGGGGGSAAQEEAVQADVRILRCETVRGERAPFPPGVGIREYGDSPAVRSTCWHIEDARK